MDSYPNYTNVPDLFLVPILGLCLDLFLVPILDQSQGLFLGTNLDPSNLGVFLDENLGPTILEEGCHKVPSPMDADRNPNSLLLGNQTI